MAIILANGENSWFFGLCYAMDWGYKGCNPYVEKHLAIFVNCFLSIATHQLRQVTKSRILVH
ncbi:MAG: hypothetical protein EWV86_13355 [Microcystis panniformis Mp_MB_F_20051200_S9D]|nr:MAG: hypothetical protein EWV86_13355 [Microcystis panniformis Mp_MB_F_20051200_S9D]